VRRHLNFQRPPRAHLVEQAEASDDERLHASELVNTHACRGPFGHLRRLDISSLPVSPSSCRSCFSADNSLKVLGKSAGTARHPEGVGTAFGASLATFGASPAAFQVANANSSRQDVQFRGDHVIVSISQPILPLIERSSASHNRFRTPPRIVGGGRSAEHIEEPSRGGVRCGHR
jgi:hypothetical protein